MNGEWGMENEECRRQGGRESLCNAGAPGIQHSAFLQPPVSSLQPPTHPPRGITLVELLITMTIIAIISAAILGTAAAAIDSARERRTQSLVAKIHTLLMEQVASYETRRIDIDPRHIEKINDYIKAGNASPQEYSQRLKERGKMLADLRLLGIRELMKYEMPDRWTDVVNGPLNASGPQGTVPQGPAVLARTPPLAQRYRHVLEGLNPSAGIAEATNWQGAECLYLTVMNATGEGEARTLFSPQEIGDVDGDGAKEFLDGWGNPISWIRWPTGFSATPLMSGNADVDHESLDLYRRDFGDGSAANPRHVNPGYAEPRITQVLGYMNNRPVGGGAFRIVPLIYSAGPDELQDITPKGDNFVADLDPYTAQEQGQDPNDVGRLPGTVSDVSDGWKDNIHNHLLEY